MYCTPLKMCSTWVNNEFYEIHRYYVPNNINKRMKLIRKYFRIMDKESIPHQYKRRKSCVEFAETALIILHRLATICDIGVPIVVGSRYLDDTPWANFGNVLLNTEAKINFRGFEDIINYYGKRIMRDKCRVECFHFRIAPLLSEKMAYEYKLNPHFILAVGLHLLYDLLLNCGPDCIELYDLFNNDIRSTGVFRSPSLWTAAKNDWQDLRCKVMGHKGRIKDKPYRYKIGQLHKPIPLTSATKIEEISQSDDIEYGERTIIIKKPAVDY